MKILIACEESQTVCCEMRRLGHEAYSCDIQECSGGHPEWHIKGDVLPLINGRCEFVTMDGERHEISDRWDMLIAHPPCTYLSSVTTRHLSLKMTPPEKVVARMWKLAEAAVFFMQLAPPQPYGYTKSGHPINFEEAGGKIAGVQHGGSRAKARSKTFPGIARAMAEQWAGEEKENRS